MSETSWSKSTVEINAPIEKVWDALTKPELVKKYFFGTMVNTDWQVGSPITFTGEWNGKAYQDKGEILEIEKGKHVMYTYWSSMGGTSDVPENYLKVTYDLEAKDSKTMVTIASENKDEESKKHSENNWDMVLQKLKDMLEQGS